MEFKIWNRYKGHLAHEMNFLIDENLTPELIKVFENQGFKASHINLLKQHKKQQVKDDQIRGLLLRKDYILITRDDDFVKSYVDRKVPNRMIYLHGLASREEVIQRFKEVFNDLIKLLEMHDFIEMSRNKLTFAFE